MNYNPNDLVPLIKRLDNARMELAAITNAIQDFICASKATEGDPVSEVSINHKCVIRKLDRTPKIPDNSDT